MRRPFLRSLAPLVAAAALLAGACGSGSSHPSGLDPVVTVEDPATVLANSQYPELAANGLKARYLLDTGEHLTQVLSFVDGLVLDERAATQALRYFEQLRQEVGLEVQGEGRTLTYQVRPRNYSQRYVVIVPDGAPLPRWAGRPEAGRSFASTRPVNVDHAVTVVRVAERPFALGPPFDALPPAAQLDLVFLSGACARSTSITTDTDAAYAYGANIHNQGEGVICNGETRQLAARHLGMTAAAMAEVAAISRVAPAAPPAPTLVAPPFDERRYVQLPDIGQIFTVA